LSYQPVNEQIPPEPGKEVLNNIFRVTGASSNFVAQATICLIYSVSYHMKPRSFDDAGTTIPSVQNAVEQRLTFAVINKMPDENIARLCFISNIGSSLGVIKPARILQDSILQVPFTDTCTIPQQPAKPPTHHATK
jgi:hypothetical protein